MNSFIRTFLQVVGFFMCFVTSSHAVNLTLTTNKTIFSPGVSLILSGSIAPTNDTGKQSDIYVAVVLPDGTIMTLNNQLSWTTILTPILSNFPLNNLQAPNFYTLQLPASLQTGRYTFYVVSAPAGADPLNSSEWLGSVNTAITFGSSPTTLVPSLPAIITVQPNDTRLFIQDRLANATLAPQSTYTIKGVNWSPISIGTIEQNLDFEFALWYKNDFALMSQMGVNTIRVYHDFGTGSDAFSILDEMWRQGIKVVMTVDSPQDGVSADLANITTVVNAYKNHPAILMWAIGNEWDVNLYYSKFPTFAQAATFTEQAAKLIKTLDSNHPVSTIIADPNIPGTHPLSQTAFPYQSGPYTQDIVNTVVPSVDVWGINLYRGNTFGDVFLQWQSISSKPVYIGEFGIDSYDHRINAENQAMQSQVESQLWDETFFNLSADRKNGVLVGGFVFEWNDEWWKNGNPSVHDTSLEVNSGQPDGYNDEEWFGIVDIYRVPKQVYNNLQNRFINGQSAVQLNGTPTITVTSDTYAQFQIDDNTGYVKTVFNEGGGAGGARGINVAVIDNNTGIRLSDMKSFDTWATFANTQALITYINNLPNGTIMAIAIADEGGFVVPPQIGTPITTITPRNNPLVKQAYELFESLGSTKIRQVQYRGHWAMITIKGKGAITEDISNPTINNGGFASGGTVNIQGKLLLTLNPDYGRR